MRKYYYNTLTGYFWADCELEPGEIANDENLIFVGSEWDSVTFAKTLFIDVTGKSNMTIVKNLNDWTLYINDVDITCGDLIDCLDTVTDFIKRAETYDFDTAFDYYTRPCL